MIIRLIYRLFLYGKSPSAIAPTSPTRVFPRRAVKRCGGQGVESILTNEKYKGDALLQKKFTVDFLTKKQKVNEGEVPQYYVTNSHPAIIEPELFDLVQYELKTRKTDGRLRAACIHFPGALSAASVAAFMAARSGTPTRKTGALYGSVTKSTGASIAPHPILQRVKSKPHFWPPSISCWGTGTRLWRHTRK